MKAITISAGMSSIQFLFEMLRFRATFFLSFCFAMNLYFRKKEKVWRYIVYFIFLDSDLLDTKE